MVPCPLLPVPVGCSDFLNQILETVLFPQLSTLFLVSFPLNLICCFILFPISLFLSFSLPLPNSSSVLVFFPVSIFSISCCQKLYDTQTTSSSPFSSVPVWHSSISRPWLLLRLLRLLLFNVGWFWFRFCSVLYLYIIIHYCWLW